MSSETLRVLECNDEATCVLNVYDYLRTGLVPILVTRNTSSDKDQNFLNFFKRQLRNINVLKVCVSDKSNLAVASYLCPGNKDPATMKYPFVTVMKDTKLLRARVYDYKPELLQDLLDENYDNFVEGYANFLIDVIKKIKNDDNKMNAIREDVLDEILGRRKAVNVSEGQRTRRKYTRRARAASSSTTTLVRPPSVDTSPGVSIQQTIEWRPYVYVTPNAPQANVSSRSILLNRLPRSVEDNILENFGDTTVKKQQR